MGVLGNYLGILGAIYQVGGRDDTCYKHREWVNKTVILARFVCGSNEIVNHLFGFVLFTEKKTLDAFSCSLFLIGVKFSILLD